MEGKIYVKKIVLIGSILVSAVSFTGEKSPQLLIFPGLSLGANKEDSISKFSFNLLGAENKNVTGLDLSLVGLRTVDGDFKG